MFVIFFITFVFDNVNRTHNLFGSFVSFHNMHFIIVMQTFSFITFLLQNVNLVLKDLYSSFSLSQIHFTFVDIFTIWVKYLQTYLHIVYIFYLNLHLISIKLHSFFLNLIRFFIILKFSLNEFQTVLLFILSL
jgi:hypothetical protein